MKRTKTRLLSLLLIVCIVSIGLSFLLIPKVVSTGESWLTGWGYRKSHLITHAASAGTNYQVCTKVYKTTGVDGTEVINGVTAGKVYVGSNCRDDFGDIRFTNDSGNTLLDCWMESYTSGASAIFWVEVAGDLSTVDKTIYVYYGKSDATYPYLATDVAQGEATFLLFDNFNDASFDVAKWTNVTGTPVEAGNYLLVQGDKVRSVNTLGTSLRFKARSQATDANSWGMGFQKADDTQYSIFQRLTAAHYRTPLNYNGSSALTEDTLPSVNVWHLFELLWVTSTSTTCYTDSSGKSNNSCVPSDTMQTEFESTTPTLYFDWVFVGKYQATEPAHSTWGSEEPFNTAPTIGAPSGTNWDDIDNLYVQKKTYTISVVYTDTDGFADIHYCELYLKTGGNVTRATFQFHEDDNSWSTPAGSTEWTLTGQSNASAGNNIAVVWGFQAQWDATEENALDFLFFVTDTAGASVNSLSGTPFDVVTRLVTESFTSDDGRINIAGTTTISGAVYYANNPGSDTASASYPPDAEFTSVSIHNSTHTAQSTDNSVINGAFSVSFSIPNTVQSNSYHAYIALADADGTDQDALDGDATAVIGDAVMLFLSIDDNRINMGGTIYANLNATYAYDGTDIITGTLKLNGTNMVYQSGNWWRLGISQATVGQWTYCVDSVTGNAYGITQLGIISLNGVADRFVIPDHAAFAFDAFTVAVWAKPTISVTDGYLISQYDAGTGDGFNLYQTSDRGDGTAAWIFEVICSGIGDFCYSDVPPVAGVWQHIVGMRDSGGNLKMYIDGVLQADTTVVGGGVVDSTSSVYIGTLFGGLPVVDYDGYLCEHRFYNRSLLLPEIYQLYQGRQTNNTGLVALYSRPSYDMDAALWRDLSGNGHDGVIVGATVTAGLSTDETVRPIWDNLTIANLQPVQYLGSGNYKYEAQLEYGYDLALIDGGYAVLAYPNGTVVGKVASNTTGWVTFIVGQLNSTSGTFNIYGENETLWTITYAGVNQTFANYYWTLTPQDVAGNSLTNTNHNVTLGTTTVWNGTALAIYVPPDTFNVTVTWLQNLVVNSTVNQLIAGDTTTNLNCTCYPYVISATRYWAASNGTITSAVYASYLLTVQFSCPINTYVLVASYATRPSYVLNVTYDYTTAFALGYLVLPHFGNTTITAGYENWAGLYVKKTDRLMLSVGWAGMRLDIVTNGTLGDSGELDVYCSSRGAPSSDSGFTVTSYIGGVFIGLYTFASPHTGSLEWTSGAASSGGTTGQPQASLFITLTFTFPKNVQSGTTVDGFLNVSWMGAATVYIWSVVVDSDYAREWELQVARLPWTLETLMQNGRAQVPVVLYITGSLAAGNYSVPCDVTFHTVEGVSKTVRSILTFEVANPIAEVPSMLVYVFLGGLGIVVTGSLFMVTKRRKKYS